MTTMAEHPPTLGPHSASAPLLDDFWRVADERHEIFIRRHIEHRPPPWTDDPLLQHARLTNVYRSLDRVTRWLTVHVLESRTLSPEDLAFNILVYRRFIRPQTFAAIGGPRPREAYVWEHVLATLEAMRRDGVTIFGGAYIISTTGTDPKHEVVVRDLEATAKLWPSVWARLTAAASLKQAHVALLELPRVGAFTAYEVLIDLCEGALLPQLGADALDSWVYAGPGAIRGVAALIGRTPSELEAAQVIRVLRDRQDEMQAAAGVRIRGPKLTLENVENLLCEYSKLVRLRAGGRIKRRYETPNPDLSLWENLPARFLEAAQITPAQNGGDHESASPGR